MANVDIRLGYKDSTWFTNNATLVLLAGQSVHLLQTGTYKIGDGTTQLSALSFLGAASSITKTSDLINDGDDGNPFISLNDLPSNLILYATTAASDIPTYVKLVSSITDPSYNTIAANVSTGAITTTNQFISALATSANVIVGNPGVLNITTIGNIRRTSGTGNAEFYFEVWKRVLAGTETLITTSGNTLPVLNGGYAEFSATALWNDGIFIATDRIVLKFYASKIVGGSNPTYDFQFGGSTPVRSLVPIPLTVSPILESAKVIYKDLTTSANLTGTTNISILKTCLIPANTVSVDDEIQIIARSYRTTNTGVCTEYLYYNTSATLTGATEIGVLSGAASWLSIVRNLFIKSLTNSETSGGLSSGNSDGVILASTSIYSLNIDWTQDAYIIQAFQNAAVGNNTTSRGITIKRFR